MHPFLLAVSRGLRPREGAFFESFAEQAKPGAVKPDGFEQAVALVDEKVESSSRHGLAPLSGDDSLEAKHAVAHVDGLLVQVSDGVLRQGEHIGLYSRMPA